jgi:hypothetical protein
MTVVKKVEAAGVGFTKHLISYTLNAILGTTEGVLIENLVGAIEANLLVPKTGYGLSSESAAAQATNAASGTYMDAAGATPAGTAMLLPIVLLRMAVNVLASALTTSFVRRMAIFEPNAPGPTFWYMATLLNSQPTMWQALAGLASAEQLVLSAKAKSPYTSGLPIRPAST